MRRRNAIVVVNAATGKAMWRHSRPPKGKPFVVEEVEGDDPHEGARSFSPDSMKPGRIDASVWPDVATLELCFDWSSCFGTMPTDIVTSTRTLLTYIVVRTEGCRLWTVNPEVLETVHHGSSSPHIHSSVMVG
jgi:hypothetical protein